MLPSPSPPLAVVAAAVVVVAAAGGDQADDQPAWPSTCHTRLLLDMLSPSG